MDLESCAWDPYLCRAFGVPPDILPTIKSSSEIYGYVFAGSLAGIPVSGVGTLFPRWPRSACPFSHFHSRFSVWEINKRRWWVKRASNSDRPNVRSEPEHFYCATLVICFDSLRPLGLPLLFISPNSYSGTSVIKSRNGLLTTVAYKFGPEGRTTYALEGSGIIAGDYFIHFALSFNPFYSFVLVLAVRTPPTITCSRLQLQWL